MKKENTGFPANVVYMLMILLAIATVMICYSVAEEFYTNLQSEYYNYRAEKECPMMQYETTDTENIHLDCWNHVYDEYGLIVKEELIWNNFTGTNIVLPIWENCNGRKSCDVFDYNKEYTIDGHKFRGLNCILSCEQGDIMSVQGVTDKSGYTFFECQQTTYKNFTTGRFLPEENMIECLGGDIKERWICREPLCNPFNYCITGNYEEYFCHEYCSDFPRYEMVLTQYKEIRCDDCLEMGYCHIEKTYEKSQTFTLEEMGLK